MKTILIIILIVLFIRINISYAFGKCIVTSISGTSNKIPKTARIIGALGVIDFSVNVITSTGNEKNITFSGEARLGSETQVILNPPSQENGEELNFQIKAIKSEESSASRTSTTSVLTTSLLMLYSSSSTLTSIGGYKKEKTALGFLGLLYALDYLPSPSLAATETCRSESIRLTVTLPKGFDAAFLNGQSSHIRRLQVNSIPATSPRSFKIQFLHLNTPSTAVNNAFNNAALRWGRIISTDLPTLALPNGLLPSSVCGKDLLGKRPPTSVDDLLIVTKLLALDGPGGTLGAAGPCTVLGGTSLGLTRIGFMQFDTDDIPLMISDGTLEGVILHEMGHVLGIGTLWANKGLIDGRGTSNPFYRGDNGNSALNKVDETDVVKVNIEGEFGAGTADSHWDEDRYGNELMTGFIEQDMRLSSITLESLVDLGYTVNKNAADPFKIPFKSQGRRRRSRRQLQSNRKWEFQFLPMQCPEDWEGPDTDSCIF